MNEQIKHLESMMNKTTQLIRNVSPDQLDHRTPCDDFDVRALLEHLAVWVQVFEAAVNDTQLPFDPSTHRVEEDWANIMADATSRIVAGLGDRGVDRPMTMTSDPIPGVFVLNMLLMEYIGHGWDLAMATGLEHAFTDDEATVALAAAQAIIAPEYRGTGMFDHPVAVGASADPITAFVAFSGRDPRWAPAVS